MSKALADPRYQPFVDRIEATVAAPASKRVYRIGLLQFFGWLRESNLSLNREAVLKYRQELQGSGKSSSTINRQIGIIKLLARELFYSDQLDHKTLIGIGAITGQKRLGRHTGNWLTREQARMLLSQPGADKSSEAFMSATDHRDAAILAVLLGCGLRRDELARLRMQDIQQREGRWVIIDLHGKGDRVRSVPMPAPVKARIDRWRDALKQRSLDPEAVFTMVRKGNNPTPEALSAEAIYQIVLKHGRAAGLGDDISPHDLRRTFARLTRQKHAQLDQIKETLGHSTVTTTEIYVGASQDLVNAPGDLLDIW